MEDILKNIDDLIGNETDEKVREIGMKAKASIVIWNNEIKRRRVEESIECHKARVKKIAAEEEAKAALTEEDKLKFTSNKHGERIYHGDDHLVKSSEDYVAQGKALCEKYGWTKTDFTEYSDAKGNRMENAPERLLEELFDVMMKFGQVTSGLGSNSPVWRELYVEERKFITAVYADEDFDDHFKKWCMEKRPNILNGTRICPGSHGGSIRIYFYEKWPVQEIVQ